jgi:hypothetical protein
LHYFKLHHEVAQDPKVQMLPAETFRAWINVLCIASANKPRRGFLPEMKHVAYVLRVSIAEAEAIIATLVGEGLLDESDGGYTPHNWDARQGRVDHSTERSRKFRQKHGNGGTKAKRDAKAKAASALPIATESQRVANAFATVPATESQRECNAPQLELERELELEVESLSNDNDSRRGRGEVGEIFIDGGTFQVVSDEHRKTIEYARAVVDEHFAAVVADRGSSLDSSLGGRWDCYRAAIDELIVCRRNGKTIDRPAIYCRSTALGYVTHGIPRTVDRPLRPDPEDARLGVFPPAAAPPRPMSAYRANEESEKAKMKNYVPKSFRTDEAG